MSIKLKQAGVVLAAIIAGTTVSICRDSYRDQINAHRFVRVVPMYEQKIQDCVANEGLPKRATEYYLQQVLADSFNKTLYQADSNAPIISRIRQNGLLYMGVPVLLPDANGDGVVNCAPKLK